MTGKGKNQKFNKAEIATSESSKDIELPKGWLQKLLARPDLVNIIVVLANRWDISSSQIKKARSAQPPFSSTQWDGITLGITSTGSFDLFGNLSLAELDQLDWFSIDAVLLPPSFHVTIAKATWCISKMSNALKICLKHFKMPFLP